MESLLDLARHVLREHPAPALPYTELHRLVARERPGPPVDAGFLFRRVRTRPDLFRCVEPWRGPWRTLVGAPGPGAGPYRLALADAGVPVDVWIVARRTGGDGEGGPPPGPRARLRTTVLELSRRVDRGSARSLARWMALLREERAVRRHMARS